jgi:uncharacterized protein YceK
VKYLWLMLACLLTGCGSIITFGFMGATMSIQLPLPQQIKPEISANVTTMPATAPATQGARP